MHSDGDEVGGPQPPEQSGQSCNGCDVYNELLNDDGYCTECVSEQLLNPAIFIGNSGLVMSVRNGEKSVK